MFLFYNAPKELLVKLSGSSILGMDFYLCLQMNSSCVLHSYIAVILEGLSGIKLNMSKLNGNIHTVKLYQCEDGYIQNKLTKRMSIDSPVYAIKTHRNHSYLFFV